MKGQIVGDVDLHWRGIALILSNLNQISIYIQV